MTHEELVELVAEAICQKTLFDGTGHGCGGFCQSKGRFERQARAAIAEVLAALNEPSNQMCVAGWKKADERDAVLGNGEIAMVWRAMLSASPLALEDKHSG